MFVADFIGSPPMNFLPFRGSVRSGATTIFAAGTRIAIPAAREDCAEGELILGVRPEHVLFSDASKLKGEVYGTEYLGTTQIVTVKCEKATLKARLPADIAIRIGEIVGLDFKPQKLSVFEAASGRAIRTALHEVPRHG